MTVIVVGELASRDGLAATSWLEPGGNWYDPGPHLRKGGYYSPAANYRREQASSIPVDINHDGPIIGRCAYLERHDGGGLLAVCEIDPDAVEGWERIYLSADVEGRKADNTYTDMVLNSVALVARSASIAKEEAVIVDTTLAEQHWPSGHRYRALLQRAAAYDKGRRYRRPQPHVIAEPDRDLALRYASSAPVIDPRSAIVADKIRRTISVDLPGVHLRSKVALTYRGEAIGSLRPDLIGSDRLLTFRCPRTRTADEALELVADGLLDVAEAMRGLDGCVGQVRLSTGP